MRFKASLLQALRSDGLTHDQIAKGSKSRGIQSTSTRGRVTQLIGWVDLLDACDDASVVTAVTTERGLRPVVMSGLDIAEQVEVAVLVDEVGNVKAALDSWLADNGPWTDSERARQSDAANGLAVVANLGVDRCLIGWARTMDRFARIDRGSDWGNPYILDDDGSRDEVCDLYATYLDTKRSLDPTRLRGSVLGCWCHPERCHGDELARRANR